MSTVDDVAGDQSRRREPSDHTSRPSADHEGSDASLGWAQAELVATGLDDHVVGSPTIHDVRDAGARTRRRVSEHAGRVRPGIERLRGAVAAHDDQRASSDDGRDAATAPDHRAGCERPAASRLTRRGARRLAQIDADERSDDTRDERRRDEYCLFDACCLLSSPSRTGNAWDRGWC